MDPHPEIETAVPLRGTLTALAARATAERRPALGALFELMASDARIEDEAHVRSGFALQLVSLYYRLHPDTGERDLVRSAYAALRGRTSTPA